MLFKPGLRFGDSRKCSDWQAPVKCHRLDKVVHFAHLFVNVDENLEKTQAFMLPSDEVANTSIACSRGPLQALLDQDTKAISLLALLRHLVQVGHDDLSAVLAGNPGVDMVGALLKCQFRRHSLSPGIRNNLCNQLHR